MMKKSEEESSTYFEYLPNELIEYIVDRTLPQFEFSIDINEEEMPRILYCSAIMKEKKTEMTALVKFAMEYDYHYFCFRLHFEEFDEPVYYSFDELTVFLIELQVADTFQIGDFALVFPHHDLSTRKIQFGNVTLKLTPDLKDKFQKFRFDVGNVLHDYALRMIP